ncbi:MAG: phage protein Gp37 [Syntrophales bacterium]
MLTDIEEKITERLEAKLAEPKIVGIDEAHGALKVPSIDVVVGGGKFEKVSQHYKLNPTVFVVVTFQNLRSVKDVRKGVYPILEAIVGLLVRNTLGLKIDPLMPRRLDNITEEKEAKEGKIVLQLEFETGFVIPKVSDEELVDLLTVGLNYYLAAPDGSIDETADAADEITLGEE